MTTWEQPHQPEPPLESTREKLLYAGKMLFAAKGYDGTSVKEIVDAAQVNVSLVSYHFNGKEGLYKACVDRFGSSRLAGAERVLRSFDSYKEFLFRIQLFVEEMLAAYLSDPEISRIVNRDIELAPALVKDVFEKKLLKIVTLLTDFIQEAQNRHFIPDHNDPHMIASLLLGSITHLTRTDVIHERYFGRSLQQEDFFKSSVNLILELFTKGICGPVDQNQTKSTHQEGKLSP